MSFNHLPVGTLDHSQTYNLTMPTAQLTVSVRDASGNAITGGTLHSTSATSARYPACRHLGRHLRRRSADANGNTTCPSPTASPCYPRIVLSNGLVVPFKARS